MVAFYFLGTNIPKVGPCFSSSGLMHQINQRPPYFVLPRILYWLKYNFEFENWLQSWSVSMTLQSPRVSWMLSTIYCMFIPSRIHIIYQLLKAIISHIQHSVASHIIIHINIHGIYCFKVQHFNICIQPKGRPDYLMALIASRSSISKSVFNPRAEHITSWH